MASAACRRSRATAGPGKKTFKSYPTGYVHIGIAEVRTEEGKLRLFVAVDRTSKYVDAELHHLTGKAEAAQCLRVRAHLRRARQ